MSKTRSKQGGKGREPKLLIVDDAPEMRELLEEFFVREGFGVVTAENGLEGVQKAREEAPDLVLLNLMMPVMDGFAACRILKSDEATRAVPVIIFSACDDAESRATALSLGAEAYVVSPFSVREVVERVSAVLDGRQTMNSER
jgi:DNA-binding response OmpR family regulator